MSKFITSKIWILLAVLMATPLVTAVTINPGRTVLINCSGTNESIPATCLSNLTNNVTCPDCPECGVCMIRKDLECGDEYALDEGTCDIEITCSLEEERKVEEREYTFFAYIDKHENGDIFLSLETEDFLGQIIHGETFDFSNESTVSQKVKHGFSCPVEVEYTGVNQRSCNAFFESYFTSAEPITMQLAALFGNSSDKLAICQQDLIETSSLMNQNKDLYTDCDKDLSIERDRVITAKNETAITGAAIRAEYVGFVPGVWMYAAIGEGVLFLLIAVVWILPKPEGGK